jgi:glycosyltransferase involved in cell wall biosynthesis
VSSAEALKISIAMATYNGGKYLREQLESFLAQTRFPDELIITDDCSTDDTLEIIQLFAETAPFVVRWEQNEKNLGYTGNFNHALMRTTGDLVFLSDQDDVWFPEKLAIMEAYVLANPTALVLMNDAALTDADLNDTGLTKQGQIASAGMTDSSFVMGSCAVVRRELLAISLPITAGFKGHDNWLVQIAEGARRKLIVKDVLQWYRRHKTNVAQVIVNRGTKVTRGMVYKEHLMNAMAVISRTERLTTDCEQARYFLEGVKNASGRASESLASALAAYSITLEERLNVLEHRLVVCENPRFARLPGIFKLWRSGGYAHFHGMKSAVQDFIFR